MKKCNNKFNIFAYHQFKNKVCYKKVVLLTISMIVWGLRDQDAFKIEIRTFEYQIRHLMRYICVFFVMEGKYILSLMLLDY